jgi:ABC-type dipeptide/oligopeptide/nickel transport system permease component
MKLAQYVVQRFISYLLVLFIGITITFFLPRLMPGDPINNYISQVQARAGQSLTPEATQQLRDSLAELYGLKGDLFTQYTIIIGRVARLRFWPLLHLLPGAGLQHLVGGDAVDGRAADHDDAPGVADWQ